MRSPAFWWEKPGIAAALLSPLARVYASVAARRLVQPGSRVGAPVICVGNPTVGGALRRTLATIEPYLMQIDLERR